MTTLRFNCNRTPIMRGILQVYWERCKSHTTKPLRLLGIKGQHQAKWATCNQSLTTTQGSQQSKNSMEREEPSLSKSHNKGIKREVPLTNQKEGQPKKKPWYNCGAEISHSRSECPSKKATCWKYGKEGHYSSVCRSKGKNIKVHEVEAKPAAEA